MVTMEIFPNATFDNVENNLFYLDGYRNGSLFNQRFNGNQKWYDAVKWPEPYPGNDHDQLVSIALYQDNLTALLFDASLLFAPKGTHLPWPIDLAEVLLESVLPLARTILDGTVDRYPVECIYPLSGQYDTLVRSLFYALLVVSLLFRRHNWLATAALGTAMTYAATSAIHLFILIGEYQFSGKDDLKHYINSDSSTSYGDPDIIGIFPILAFSAVMVTPVLNWSSTVRKSKAQAVVIWWGVLIIAALIPATVYMGRCAYTSYYATGNMWISDTSISYISCESGCLKIELLSTSEFNRCNCLDFCPLISPTSPLRKGGNMVAVLSQDLSVKTTNSPDFIKMWKVSLVAVAMVLGQLIYSIITARSSQVEIRAWVFEFLNGEGKQKKNIVQKTRQLFATVFAGSLYIGAILFALLCPLIGILTIVLNELLIQSFPRSEHSDAVGAWATWVGTGFVIIAGLIARYHESWWTTVVIGLETIWLKYAHARGKKDKDFEQLIISQPGGNPRQLRERVKAFFKEVISPFVHVWTALRTVIWVLKANTRFFLEWCKDPVEQSTFSPIELKKRWLDLSPKKPQCDCAMCAHARAQRADSDEDDEFEAIISKRVQLYDKRVKRWLGNGYEIAKTGDVTSSQGHGQQDDAFDSLVIEFLRKRMKRRMGSEYDIARVGERELDTLRCRSDDTISPSMTSTEQQHQGSVPSKPVPSVHRSPS